MKIAQLIFIFLFTGLVINAQEPLSLTDAIQIALENNYEIRMIKQDQLISEINNNWGTAGRYPYINFTAGDENSYNLNKTENFASNRFTAGLALNWTLFDGFAVRINKTRFEELEELSKHNTAIIVEGTIQSVILAYYNILLQEARLKNYDEVMQLSEARFKRAEGQKEYGTAVTYDVLQAQNAYLSDRAGFLLQQVAYKNAKRDLNYLLAEKEPKDYELTEKFEALAQDYVLGDLQAQMIENNKSLQNQYINQRLLENAVTSAKSNLYPTIDFRGGASGTSARNNYETSDASWTNNANFYGNFTLSYNLFSGGNRKRAIQIANIEEEIGQVQIEEMQHDLNNKLANLFEFYQVQKELLSVAAENLAAAKLNLQISREKFEAGAINSFNFRDVQILYLNAAQQKLEAIYDFIDAHTSLLRMAGTIIQQYE